MDTSKVNRVEVIDHTRTLEEGGGRVYTYWNQYDSKDFVEPEVSISIQDDGRTLKIFIS